jgi:hypothetical protein
MDKFTYDFLGLCIRIWVAPSFIVFAGPLVMAAGNSFPQYPEANSVIVPYE